MTLVRLMRGGVLLTAVGLGLAHSAEHVVVISVDGLRPAAVNGLGQDQLPHFFRLRTEGVWTDNARTDYDFTYTVANHVSIVTGRGVKGDAGHRYGNNGNPSTGQTLHRTNGNYVAGMFDAAHDAGLATALYCTKDKLVILDWSYNADAGAPDVTGEDNGPDKIDSYIDGPVTDNRSTAVVEAWIADSRTHGFQLSLLHLIDPDAQGHGDNWETQAYFDAVIRVDEYLGSVLDFVETEPGWAGRTTIILTADHGGAGGSHGDPADPENYVIPFYVWGADVGPGNRGRDLYALNLDSRTDPERSRPTYGSEGQPVRNGDAANLALDLLGLPPIPGSTINARQELKTEPTKEEGRGLAPLPGCW